jgi:lambda repressor-like predicted transcriptional regulator
MSTEKSLGLQYSFFLVDERPFCLWDMDLKKRTLEFVDNLDPSYFDYEANLHIEHIGENDQARSKESQHAALALRTAYSQALETLFALISATLQAPRCIAAWINLYKNHELRNVIDKIHNRKPLLHQLKFELSSWTSITEIVFQALVLEDKEKEAAIKNGFAQLWSRFASDFLDKEFVREYNSIKHGLRIRAGGFSFTFGPEEKPGVPAERMILAGKSDFGSAYFAADRIGDLNQHVQMTSHHRNWHPEDLGWGLHMAALSIANVQSAIKVLCGVQSAQVQFHSPTDFSAFSEPWKRATEIRVMSMSGFDFQIQPEYIEPFTKEGILAGYKDGTGYGTRNIFFKDQAHETDNS